MGFLASAIRRLPKRPKGIRQPNMSTGQLPAPTLGLNLKDGLASMKPSDALILDNWFPEATYCRIRGGYTSHVTGLGAAVQSLMEWGGPSSRKLFGATPTAIYDVTAAGAVGAAVVSGLGSGYWSTVNITTAGGAFMVLANGVDSVRNYDGTSWTTPAITNVTSSTLDFVTSHKSRLWFVQKNTTKAWYLPTSSIAGAAVAFELGERFTDGGKLVGIGSVSRDGGSGSDDYLAFVSSHGQVAVFAGDDPASANTWTLVGVYNAAPPVGNRSLANVGGDLAILTESAIVSTRQLMAGGQAAAERQSITIRIDQGIQSAFASYGAVTGWSVMVYPRTRQAIFNIPTASTTAFQYVVNTQTGAWCSYSGLQATCWGIMSENPYFGTSGGTVYLFESGYSDAGVAINTEMKTSFQSYGNKGALSRVCMVRPIFSAGGRLIPQIKMNMDYRNDQPMTTDAFPLSNVSIGAVWDTAVWDAAAWGDTESPYADWFAATGIGTVASFHMITQTNGINARVNAIDVMFEKSETLAL